jgi:hypothetical protein
MKRLLSLAVAGLGLLAAALPARPVSAQVPEENPYAPVRRDPIGPRLVDMPTPFTVGARRVEVLFSHRFQQTVSDGRGHNLWGLDSGADVGLGLAWGVSRNFDLGVYRSSFQENFELAGKFLVFEQAPRVPFSIGLRAGADLPQRSGIEDRRRPFGQLLLSRSFGHGVDLFVSPTWVRDTPQLRKAFNVPVGLTIPLPARHFLELEYIPRNRDLKGSVAAWHVAILAPVGNHLFTLVVGNSRATTVDQYTGGDAATGFKAGDVRLGFNLVRNFDF